MLCFIFFIDSDGFDVASANQPIQFFFFFCIIPGHDAVYAYPCMMTYVFGITNKTSSFTSIFEAVFARSTQCIVDHV